MTQVKTPIAAPAAVAKPVVPPVSPVVKSPANAPVDEGSASVASPTNTNDLGDVAASSDTAKASMGARVTPESAAAAKSEYAEAWGMDPTVC